MDAIVALATPWGHSALAVIRLSGHDAHAVLRQTTSPMSTRPLEVGRPRRVLLQDTDGAYDDGVAILGRAPRTYTGEDTVELTCHGNPVIVERYLAAAVAAGARLAEPGEFTRRAVLAGKLDLVRAEAVLQMAEAASARGLAIGRAALGGQVSAIYGDLRTRLVSTTAELEARLDYPGDELALEGDDALVEGLRDVAETCRSLARSESVGRVLVHGARVALVGAVNAGKSSLFNALIGRRRALVHDRAGTTRDVLEMRTTLGGVPVTLLDTAGERETDDPIEAAGLALAQELVGEADGVVVVLRARRGGPSDVEQAILDRTVRRPRVVVYNGVDDETAAAVPAGALPTVATTGEGVDAVAHAVGALFIREESGGREVIASARQRDALLGIARSAEEAITAFTIAGVAVASEEVVRAIEALDAMTGADTREEVLDALFARFCIGK